MSCPCCGCLGCPCCTNCPESTPTADYWLDPTPGVINPLVNPCSDCSAYGVVQTSNVDCDFDGAPWECDMGYRVWFERVGGICYLRAHLWGDSTASGMGNGGLWDAYWTLNLGPGPVECDALHSIPYDASIAVNPHHFPCDFASTTFMYDLTWI